jgi:WD40 repeat protein
MTDGALVWAVVVAVVVAMVMLVTLLSPYIARQALAGEGFASLRAVTLAVAPKGYTTFRGANLTSATFTQATLKNTDFREAILTGASFTNCHQLDEALLDENPSQLALFRNQPTTSGVRSYLFVLGILAISIGQQNFFAYFPAYSPHPLEIVASLRSSTILQRVLIGHSDSPDVISSDKTLSPFGLNEYTKTVTSVAFSPDEQTLASGSWDKTIKLWDLRTGRLIRTLTGHSNWVWSVAISPNGQTLVSSSSDGTIKLWNLRTGQLIRTLTEIKDGASSFAISADGQTVATAREKTIKLWNLRTGELLGTLSSSDRVGSLTLSPDGQILANRLGGGSYYELSQVELWNLRTGQLVRTLPERYWLHSVVISPDGQTLASVRGSTEKNPLALVNQRRRQIGIVELWDLRTGQLINTLAEHYSIESVVINPSGQILAAGGDNNLVKVWNLRTEQLLCTLSTGKETGRVNSVAISPSGQILASGSSDGTIKIWRLPRH